MFGQRGGLLPKRPLPPSVEDSRRGKTLGENLINLIPDNEGLADHLRPSADGPRPGRRLRSQSRPMARASALIPAVRVASSLRREQPSVACQARYRITPLTEIFTLPVVLSKTASERQAPASAGERFGPAGHSRCSREADFGLRPRRLTTRPPNFSPQRLRHLAPMGERGPAETGPLYYRISAAS